MSYPERLHYLDISLNDDLFLPELRSAHAELIYVLEGEVRLSVEDHHFTMHSGDVIVVNSGDRFYYGAQPGSLVCRIRIPYELIQGKFSCNSVEEDLNFDELRRVLNRLLDEYVRDKDETDYFGLMSSFYSLLDYLKAHFVRKEQGEKPLGRKEQIEAYMRLKYNQEISLNDLADRLGLSIAYLSRYFKKIFGSNFETALIQLRLFHAVEDLLNTDYTIGRIAAQNGFSNVSLMNRAFRAVYHQTAAEYREANKKADQQGPTIKEKELRKRAGVILHREKQDPSPQEDVLAEEIVLDASVRNPYIRNWNEVINIGSAEQLLQAAVQEQILLIKNELGFSGVRIWNMLSEEMLGVVDPDSEIYYFRKPDQVLDFLVENGMHPFIDLCMAHETTPENSWGSLRPQSLADLKTFNRLTERFLQHAIHRYGREEVKTWRFEFWNRRQDDAETEEELEAWFAMFRSEYGIIKSILPEIEVGGCGSSSLLNRDTFREMIRRWPFKAPLPDFLSVKLFAYQRSQTHSSDTPRHSSDPDYISHALRQIREDMEAENFPVSRLYVTEWNQTLSDQNALNDSCFRAAYNLRTIFGSLGQADLMIYDYGTDLCSNYRDTNDLLHGGLGLLTKDGLIKPAGYVFSFMKEMLPHLNLCSSHCMATTDGRGSFVILCHNGKQLNNHFYNTGEDRLQHDRLWQYYEDTRDRVCRLVLQHVESRLYQAEVWQLNEENGSVLDQWQLLEFCDTSSREMIRSFRRSVHPAFYYFTMLEENGQLSLEWRMKANEVILIRIHGINE